MAKTKYKYVCQSCGYTTAKWLGRGPECGAWDSLVEEAEVATSGRNSKSYLPTGSEKSQPRTIASEAAATEIRTPTRLDDLPL